MQPNLIQVIIGLKGGADEQSSVKRKSRLLRYWLDEDGNRVYTVRKLDPSGCPTYSAYPADFSPGCVFIVLFF